jgi:hypothetical protein
MTATQPRTTGPLHPVVFSHPSNENQTSDREPGPAPMPQFQAPRTTTRP